MTVLVALCIVPSVVGAYTTDDRPATATERLNNQYEVLYQAAVRSPKVSAGRNVARHGRAKDGKHFRFLIRKERDRLWRDLHPAAERKRQIDLLVKKANAWPIGPNPATGARYINGADYALFPLVVPGGGGECLRVISGRETGGTYDHRYSYGFAVLGSGMATDGRAGGIGQAKPPSKMLPWQRKGISIWNDPVGQIEWMLAYSYDHGYGGPCPAMNHHLAVGSW